mmetsp:Transcript_75269/g.214083  ORF Transcript_75269/g.214083 Transcript_75269/m.214083 type:complete len:410 (-) Transcript_75269:414-1643(-)|eukprot:CAMPEP_0119482882 /NCGR_PEP_ID=MMETSP1344-20130328/10543_1 /TAXON_ID=236787 /ORGANISM="Florenciella parvula, Strain CCMP2471" /LENGTH=409 /DNA_ID=CAMNT_0007517335 /DNA_START=149 /DNA_END=1378 /DNA_ORIENTATION=+
MVMRRASSLQPMALTAVLAILFASASSSPATTTATTTTSSSTSDAPLRLTVSGSQLLDPITGEDVRLTGFNWVLNHLHEGDGTYMQSLMPGANAARIVAVLWDDSTSSSDCMTNVAPYFKESCFDELDFAIQQAQEAGVWSILTAKSTYGAGQNYKTDPDSDMFHNATLKSMFFTMWQHVAEHYSTWDYIAAYEIMSEPRDKDVSSLEVHDFYMQGCEAVQAIDAITPCMVGSGSYYKLWDFNDDVIIANNSNVIYTFDYFVPDDWAFGGTTNGMIDQYPGTYLCKDLYPGWSGTCCPQGANKNMTFDADWDRANLETWAVPVRESNNVPIFINQWGVVHGVTEEQGRYDYMSDMAALMEELNIGWTWWVFRGGGGDTWAHGSFEFVYQHTDGSLEVDEMAVAAVSPYM